MRSIGVHKDDKFATRIAACYSSTDSVAETVARVSPNVPISGTQVLGIRVRVIVATNYNDDFNLRIYFAQYEPHFRKQDMQIILLIERWNYN